MFETIRLIFFPIVIAQALAGAINPKIIYSSGNKKEINVFAKEYKAQKVKTANQLIKAMGIPLVFESR